MNAATDRKPATVRGFIPTAEPTLALAGPVRLLPGGRASVIRSTVDEALAAGRARAQGGAAVRVLRITAQVVGDRIVAISELAEVHS